MNMETLQWQGLRYLLELNILVALLGSVVWCLLWVARTHWFRVSYGQTLRIIYGLMFLSLAAPWVNWESTNPLFTPVVQTYSGEKHEDFKRPEGRKIFKIASITSEQAWVKSWSNDIDLILMAFSLLGAVCFALRFLSSRRRLRNLISNAVILKRYKRSRILSSEFIQQPFSVRMFSHQLVFLPDDLLSKKSDLALVLKHELQHHRQGDTVMAYVHEMLRCILFYDPFSWILHDCIGKFQELACDEALIGRWEVSSREYGRCLLEAATQPLGMERAVGTTGLSTSAKFLKRRILAMSTMKSSSKFHIVLLVSGLFAAMTGSAWAAKGLLKDNRISFEKAEELVEKANAVGTIPVFVNQDVLRWLNLGVGTERGRMYMRAAFKRMKAYKPMIQKHLQSAKLPEELLAVPLLESGYQNYDNGTAAGIWSFVPQTARNYGLNVNDEVDERYDAEKLTGAAMAYYNHLIGIETFKGNWHLALIAYNSGERNLINAVEEVGSTDALEVIRKARNLRKENVEYLPRFMAFLIIMRNPQLLE